MTHESHCCLCSANWIKPTATAFPPPGTKKLMKIMNVFPQFELQMLAFLHQSRTLGFIVSPVSGWKFNKIQSAPEDIREQDWWISIFMPFGNQLAIFKASSCRLNINFISWFWVTFKDAACVHLENSAFSDRMDWFCSVILRGLSNMLCSFRPGTSQLK